jgi:hypothetical protein
VLPREDYRFCLNPAARLHPVLVAVASSFSVGARSEALSVPLGVTLPAHLIFRVTLCLSRPSLVWRHLALSKNLHR